MAVAGESMVDGGAIPTPGHAAMNTPNPNVHLLHEVREWLVSQGHSPDEEYQIVIRRSRQTVGMLTLLPSSRPTLPPRLPCDPGDFTPTPTQCRMMDAMSEKPMSQKQLAAIVNRKLVYLRTGRGTLAELVEVGLVEESGDKFKTTQFAAEMYGHDSTEE